ncbi:MAG: TonB-dependent receptor [Gammaproteobacteria bacterium]|nr:TonB-dependent receptor [Gammaproteobacteria bacterium]
MLNPRKLLITSIAAVAAGISPVSYAQDDGGALEEVIVRGIRSSIERSIDTKREADSVVDAISAEDIGKLPDSTIADSLQRIPGIQITRSAGEGGTVAIRGLPQVVTQLNGEQYIPASSITVVQPDFGDIPSQLFKGADVHKSTTAKMVNAGITGTVNLKTHRPFDFEEGMTGAASIELQSGEETAETDPVLSGLINWNNGKVGFMLAGAQAHVNLANYYNGGNTAAPQGDAGWWQNVNGWGPQVPWNSASPQGVVAWNQVVERERIGLNAAFQADLGEGFELVAEWFYTDEDEYNRKVGASATMRWQSPYWFQPSIYRDTGVAGSTWYSIQEYDFDAYRVKSFTQNDSFYRDSRNTNVELNYDNGGALTFSARAVRGNANEKRRHGYNEGDLSSWNGTAWAPGATPGSDDNDMRFILNESTNNGFYPDSVCDAVEARRGLTNGTYARVGSAGGCYIEMNPEGYGADPQIRYNTQGAHPVWSGFDTPIGGGLGPDSTLRQYMANLDSYKIGAFSSENNANSEGAIEATRFDMSYALEDTPFITSIDAGIRQGKRSVTEDRYHLFSPFYDEGCLVQWKAVDVVLNSTNPGACTAGEDVGGVFQGYTALPPTDLDQYANVIWVDDFGPIGSVPGVWAVDPKTYDDPAAFHNRVFGSTVKAPIPGTSYTINLNEDTFYLQTNFEVGGLSGNLGFRYIDTLLQVKQNVIGTAMPYGNTNPDTGDTYSERKFNDKLPALNLAYDFTDALKLRFAYAKTMTQLNLNQWGDGMAVNYVIDNNPANPTFNQFIISSATLNGNPDLDPFRADNFDLALEWYLGDASMLNAAYFKVDVESFVKNDTIDMQLPDADGVIRRTTSVSAPLQGEGGEIKGYELGARLALSDILDSGILTDFGVDVNWTHSPSETDDIGIQGNKLPFPGNSEDQYNLVLWYEGGPFQARIAYNQRSDQLISTGNAGGNLVLYQNETAYMDISASYDITDQYTVYFAGSNVTGEYEDFYLEWEDQFAYQNYLETRYTLGVRGRF